MTDGAKHQPFSIGRSDGMANDVNIECRWIEFLLKPDGIINPLFYVAGKWYFGCFVCRVHVNLPDFSIAPYYDLLVVRCPCIIGIQAKYRPCFLLVFAELVIDRPFFT